QHDAWIAERDRGQKMHNMLQHPGWTEVLEPLIQDHRKSAVSALMNDDFEEPRKFYLVRSTIKAIDLVLSYPKNIIAVGESAMQSLKKETEE
ncbi:MAG: hypothetical protein ACYSW3_30565, partial [Planctomycetota bacterium]